MTTRAGFVILLTLMYPVQGSEFLIAVHHKSPQNSVHVYGDETGGMIYYTCPNYDLHRYKSVPSRHGTLSIFEHLLTIRDVEHKGILVTTSSREANIEVRGTYSSFAPLPTSALGTKYIVSTCLQNRHFSLFVIAAYNVTTFVSITSKYQLYINSFPIGNKRSVKLKPFQTLTFEKYSTDFTGTVITSTQPIAVFSGMTNSTLLTAYEQLLPVSLYDKKYVVAVDDNPSLYHLQIISEQNDTLATFNNGSTFTINSTVYKTQLTPQERFYFQSSNPVMVTICRRDSERSGFVVVPPVSLYSKRVAYITYNSIFISQKETFINSSNINWTHIHNSDFKTGVLLKGSIYTKVHGCEIEFNSNSIQTNAITNMQPNRFVMKKSYLVALPNWSHQYAHLQISSSKASFYQVVFPRQNQTHSRQILANRVDTFYIETEMKVQAGVENKAIRVDLDSVNTEMSFVEYYLYKYFSSIYPTSLLGQTYIIQSCYGYRPTEFQLIIVSASSNTDISVLLKQVITYEGVEYQPGDKIRVNLQPYQTLTINSSVALCGTSVFASNNIAVFILNRFEETTLRYNQLLPIEEFGQDYLVTTTDQGNIEYGYVYRSGEFLSFGAEFYLLVTSATNNAQVHFDDHLQVIEEGIAYREDLRTNTSLHLSSSKPVMVSLCTDVSVIFEKKQFNHSGCTLIIPANTNTTDNIFEVKENGIIQIMSENKDAEIIVKWSNEYHWNVSIDVKWESHTHFKIGTARIDRGQVTISSTDRFTTMVFSVREKYLYEPSIYPNDLGNIWNPLGWTTEQETESKSTDITTVAGMDSTTTAEVSGQDGPVNTTAVAIGTSLSVLILILLAVIIWQQIYIRRRSGPKREKTVGRTREMEATYNQNQPRDPQDSSTVSTVEYSDLHTEPQVQNTYESINPSFSSSGQIVYENVETTF